MGSYRCIQIKICPDRSSINTVQVCGTASRIALGEGGRGERDGTELYIYRGGGGGVGGDGDGEWGLPCLQGHGQIWSIGH